MKQIKIQVINSKIQVASDNETRRFDSFKESGDNLRTSYVLKKFMPDDNTAISW